MYTGQSSGFYSQSNVSFHFLLQGSDASPNRTPPSLFSLLIQHVLGMAALVYHFIQHLVRNWAHESGVIPARQTLLFRNGGIAWFDKPFGFSLVAEGDIRIGSIAFASFSFEFNLDTRVLRNIFEVVTCSVLYRWPHPSALLNFCGRCIFYFLVLIIYRHIKHLWKSHFCCKCLSDIFQCTDAYLKCQMFC